MYPLHLSPREYEYSRCLQVNRARYMPQNPDMIATKSGVRMGAWKCVY